MVCVAFNLQPSSVVDGRDLPGSGGNSWSWLEGSLDPFLFPQCCLSLLGHPEHLLNHWFSCGSSPSQRQAKRLLGQIVDRCRNGPGFHNETDGNSTIQEILIPASKVGLVIGKGGETIKQLQVRDSWPSSASGGLHFLHLPAREVLSWLRLA